MNDTRENDHSSGQGYAPEQTADQAGPENIDVEKIMADIRATIAEKKKQGLYSDEEIDEIARLKLETYADSAEIDMQLVRYLREGNRLWNISSDYPVSSHRGRFVRLIVLAKKIIRPFVRLYTDHLVERQAQLNLYTVHILHNVISELTRLKIENVQLQHRVDVLEHELRFFGKRERTLEDIVVYKNESGSVPSEDDEGMK